MKASNNNNLFQKLLWFLYIFWLTKMKGLEMVICESLRINMFRITTTREKLVNFLVTAWNYSKNDCDEETGKEYSTIVQIIVKDDPGKALAWRSVSCKMTYYQVSDEKTVQILSLHFVLSLRSVVYILYLVGIFYPVCSLHSILTGLVLLFLFERASSPDRNIGARKEILVRLSWPLWLICGLYIEELPRTSTMIEQ